VPTDADGFSYTPIETIGDARTFATYYEDVRVPISNVVGGEAGLDQGWRMIVTQLNYERVSLCSAGLLERKYVDVRRWAQQTKLRRRAPRHRPGVGAVHLARVHAKLDALRLINYKVASDASKGITKVAGLVGDQGLRHRAVLRGLRAAARGPGWRRAAQAGHAGSTPAKGALERAYRGTLILTFGGGTNEIQRDLVADLRAEDAPPPALRRGSHGLSAGATSPAHPARPRP
jgi:3-oxocholest-4-en-26-oyl-CoA dehydrogenase alpha subunit